jgi:hypothetical protein
MTYSMLRYTLLTLPRVYRLGMCFSLVRCALTKEGYSGTVHMHRLVNYCNLVAEGDANGVLQMPAYWRKHACGKQLLYCMIVITVTPTVSSKSPRAIQGRGAAGSNLGTILSPG